MADLELRHLRVVHTIGETGSLTKAAGRLGMTQPALSAMLARIERAVGGELFVRGPHGAHPTALGQFIIARAKALLADMDALSGAVRRRQRGTDARLSLRVGTTPLFMVEGFLKRLADDGGYEKVSSQFEPSSQTVLRLLATEHIDVALCTSPDGMTAEDTAGLTLRAVAREPLVVAVAARHPLASRDAIDLADLADCDWVMPPPPDNPIRQRMLSVCGAAGYTPRIRHVTSDSVAGRMLVVQGAVTFGAGASKSRGDVVVRPLAGNPLVVELLFATRAGDLPEEIVEDLYRTAAYAYVDTIDRNPYLRRWWTEHPESHSELDLALAGPGGS